MINLYFQFFGLLDVVLLCIIYFSKKRYKNIENKIYGYLIVFNLFGQLLHIASYITIYNMEKIMALNFFITKFYLVYLIVWVSFFFLYIFAVTNKQKNLSNSENSTKKASIIIMILDLLLIIVVMLLPTYYYRDIRMVYTYGESVNLIYIVSTFYIIISSFLFIKYIKNVKRNELKKYIPLFVLVLFGGIVMFIQYKNPSLLLITSTETFITFLMYFTIENPDMKMIEEIYKSKKIADKINEDKSNFLFSVTHEIRKSINEVDSICNYTMELEDIEAVKKTMQNLKYIISNAKNRLNSSINISTMDMKNIKVVNSKYNLKTIIKEIEINLNEKQKENVDVRFNVSETVPQKLYGDSVKIKQILTTLLLNSLKYTKKGYIETEIKSIEKNDICRLIINITDTGKGMELKQINEILDNKEELTETDYEIYNSKTINLKLINKIIQIMGGTIIINSDMNEGTRINIMIDQKIVEEKEDEKLKEYADNMYNRKKVLVVITEGKEKKKLEKVLSKIEAEIEYTESSKYLLDQVRDKEKYDLFIVEEEIKKINGHELLEKLEKEGNKTPIILYSKEENSMENEKLYLKEGFSDVIFDIDKKDLIDTVEKYLTKE